jgi:hypothetical protein
MGELLEFVPTRVPYIYATGATRNIFIDPAYWAKPLTVFPA